MISTDQTLTKEDDFKLTQVAAKKPYSEDDGTPKYMEKLELTQGQQERILAEIKEELDEIKKERDELGLEKKWKALQSQYEGIIEEDDLRQFNLCRRITKVKCDAVERLIMKAFWKSDPKFSVTARPEFDRENGEDVCQAQEDFLDYKIDNEIDFMSSERKTVHSAVVLGTGIKKWSHELRREKRKREECYRDLESFLRAYPDAKTTYPGFVAKLASGKTLTLVSEYEQTTYNDPKPKFIPLKDFYVRTACEGYEGMKTERLLAERQNYSWWQLKAKEKYKFFYNIDKLMYDNPEDEKKDIKKAGYATKKYDVLECTFYFKLKETDDDYCKLIIWVAEKKWIVIGSIYYPYYGLDCVYNVKQIMSIWDGFYQPGIAEYLTDNNIAENAILNFTLEGALAANTITPIAEATSPIHSQFLDKRWTHGVPIELKAGEKVDFLNKYIGGFNHGQMLTLLEWLGRDDGDVSGVAQLLTGGESELDPSAPATKTIALMRQSGINIEDYIDTLLPSASRDANMILQLYYQMSEEGAKYAPKPERVVGGNPFKVITRQDMIARTNIQSQARNFNFDQDNEKRENLAMYQVLRNELVVAKNPNAVYAILRALVKSWSPMWRNKIDQILPPLEQFQAQQQVLIAKGVAGFLGQKIQEAQAAGQDSLPEEPPAIVEQLVQVITDLTAESMTPPSEEVVKQREKEAQGVA